MKRPYILVTNDDGITAGGIRALVEVARELGDVIVVAPDSPQSGMGHAITIHEPLRLHKSNIFEGIEAWECSGTPVDCVKLAKHVICKDREFDICVSGINHGSNASINIMYSGTLSAAMEASLEGKPSIGFSLLDYRHDANFEPSKPYVRAIMEYVIEHGMGDGNLLNVNIPALPSEEIKGMKVCRQGEARWVENFMEAKDPRNQPYYWLTGEFKQLEDKDDTDVSALNEGYISIVPSMHDWTNYPALKQLPGLHNRSL